MQSASIVAAPSIRSPFVTAAAPSLVQLQPVTVITAPAPRSGVTTESSVSGMFVSVSMLTYCAVVCSVPLSLHTPFHSTPLLNTTLFHVVLYCPVFQLPLTALHCTSLSCIVMDCRLPCSDGDISNAGT